MNEPYSWGTFSDAFVDELVDWIGDRRVLEVFAGNGYLASLLAARGVDILATTLFSGHDAHERGMFYAVEELEASAAVREHGEGRDVLLMSWPTATEAATKAALAWGDHRPIVFIGEVTRPELGFSGLGGCASDLFFEFTRETEAFGSYTPKNLLERAAVRHFDQAALNRWLHDREDRGVERAMSQGPRPSS